jgi:hypothetical protein
MTDIATIEARVEQDIDVAEPVVNAVLPAIASLPGLSWLSLVWNAIEAIKNSGKKTSAAVAEFASHITPGMPNSPTLSG